jgi:hypothetical protein
MTSDLGAFLFAAVFFLALLFLMKVGGDDL